MKIVSPLGIVLAVLLAALVVGCSSGPGQAPADDMEEMPPEEMTTTPPVVQVFNGTFMPVPDATNPLMGMITATITGISNDGTALTGEILAGAIAEVGAEQTFNYELSADLTIITLTGDLLTDLGLPGGSVTATREGQPDANPLNALFGTWTVDVPNPQTMATSSLTLVTAAPNTFTLTVDNTPPSS